MTTSRRVLSITIVVRSLIAPFLVALFLLSVGLFAQQPTLVQLPPPPVDLEAAKASEAALMKAYLETVPGTEVSFSMTPIQGGTYLMGSPEDEVGRRADEGPRQTKTVDAFWIGTHEVTWDLFRLYQLSLDSSSTENTAEGATKTDSNVAAEIDAISRPTPPYIPMDFGMGLDGYPAISMTQFSARHFTKWLSYKTGRYYRLPSEAEWEYACRAGSNTPYSFGTHPKGLEDKAWYFDNSEDQYQPVGTLEPNPWGLYDMHGNVAEWTLDRYGPYSELEENQAVAWPTQLHPRVARGGSWDDDPAELRCAARRGSREAWQRRDPQLPKSIWYLTDAKFLGLRLVRPFASPTGEDTQRWWEPDTEEVREILENQKAGRR